ncbi:MAG: TIGR00289 family protein [Methanobrevibacter sp.]|jgi:ABC transporter with metal-binding/Fe-S-binding domain ATP-binding protein|nr:TIGR00289 family protein [Candidatus Methanovirga aequatorialis]
MNSAILFSGGKDSTMALYSSILNGDDVKYLLSMKSLSDESYMFHVPNIDLSGLIAEALDIPHITVTTDGKKEEELTDLEKGLIKLKNKGVESIYSGALFSTYQKTRIDCLCEDVGLKSIAPLWHTDPEEYMRNIVNLGFKVIITEVSAEGLGKSWLGREIIHGTIDELVAIKNDVCDINLCFEGGEAETLVLDGPIFKKKIKVVESETVWKHDTGVYNIKKAILENK